MVQHNAIFGVFILIQHTPACSVMMKWCTYPGNTLTSCNIMCLSALTLPASGLGLYYVMMSVFGAVSACSVAVPPVTRSVVGFSNFNIAHFVLHQYLQYSKKAAYPCLVESA